MEITILIARRYRMNGSPDLGCEDPQRTIERNFPSNSKYLHHPAEMSRLPTKILQGRLVPYTPLELAYIYPRGEQIGQRKAAMSNTAMEEWSTEQAEIGKRIHERAKEIGITNLVLLYGKITAVPKSGVLLSQSSFEAVLRGRPSPQFTHIVNAAVEVFIAEQESRAVERSTQPEVDLKKRQLRHFIMEGDDEDEYELHEVERHQKEEALTELEREAAKTGWKLYRFPYGEGLTNP